MNPQPNVAPDVTAADTEWNEDPTFSQWLYYRRDGNTLVAQVAQWIYDDLMDDGGRLVPCWPRRSNTLTHMIVHLRQYHRKDKTAPSELDLRKVFAQYVEFSAAGGKVPVRRGGIEPDGLVRVKRAYVLTQEVIDAIRELADWRGCSQSAVLRDTIMPAYEAAKANRRLKRVR